MGNAHKSQQIPELLDLKTAKRLTGHRFNSDDFHSLAVDGLVSAQAWHAHLQGSSNTLSSTQQARDEVPLSAGHSTLDSQITTFREGDPDLTAEANIDIHAMDHTPFEPSAPPHGSARVSKCPFARLYVPGGRTHQVSAPTQKMLKFVGGKEAIARGITRFYKYAFKNKHLQRFFRNFEDPHASRLANWIAEKMGDPSLPWTTERRTRDTSPVIVAGGRTAVIHDRSSAHVAAWFSPKREPHKVGQHFKLEDCRLWMRLNFLAMREEGLFDHSNFQDWYVRFIAHFMRVYEKTAPQFAQESLRWSADQNRVKRYHLAVQNGLAEAPGNNTVLGISYSAALKQLPESEKKENTQWPYEQQ